MGIKFFAHTFISMKKYIQLFAFSLVLICIQTIRAQVSVHPNHRYLQTAAGKPFFWLGDTDWELFHRLTREEAAIFLETRRRQGFNVIQAVVLAEMDGLRAPNRYGDLPLRNDDPAQWAVTAGDNPADSLAYDYWDHVDYIVRTAAQKGLYIGLLPTWGDKVAHLWGDGPIIFNPENARQYGFMLAKHFESYWNIIWILGGDRPAVYKGKDGREYDDRPVWRAMAEGIKAGEGHSHQLMAYHPWGGSNSTTQYIHDEPWLDLNAFQSGHGSREADAWAWVARDLSRTPAKPTIDLEPCYEDHPVNPWDGKWTRARGYFTAFDVRVRSYRTVFAGACGVTYGHHQIWQFLDTSLYAPINIGDTLIGWEKAMQAEAAGQMRFLKNLMYSRPYFNRIPDQNLIAGKIPEDWTGYLTGTRDQDRSWAMIHLPESRPLQINLSQVSGQKKKAWWFNPRTGKSKRAKVPADGLFHPPSGGRDWVLVIDDAAKGYPKPGMIQY